MTKDKHHNSHTHAVMFHHFHNERHPVGQGSISAIQFSEMIDWLADRFSLLNADEYLYRLKKGSLGAGDICLTFDDALLCQADIAAPILKSKNIQCFFFIYSSPFMGNPDYLEIYRYFRTTQFHSMEDFYKDFFSLARKIFQEDYELAEREYALVRQEYLADSLFYTPNDKWFRFLRDNILGKERYDEVMRLLMAEHHFDPREHFSKLWMNDTHLRSLQTDGHAIGLHSYSHPTMLHLLDKESQENEYALNYKHLSEILNARPLAMSHPCGNYNNDTLAILKNKGIEIGFRSNNSIKEIRSNLEVPREDHANVLKEMSK